MSLKKTFSILCFALLLSCASNPGKEENPLKHSPRLIKEGHSSLYHNGAFQVPHTEIRLIPAGPRPLELAMELAGLRARQAFLTSLKNAADSVYLIPRGSKLSLEYAKKIQAGGDAIGDSITDTTRSSGTLLIKRSAVTGAKLVLGSWRFGAKTGAAMYDYGIEIEEDIIAGGSRLASDATESGISTIGSSWGLASDIASASTKGAKKSLFFAGNQFVKGYAAVPRKYKKRGQRVARAASAKNFSDALDTPNHTREVLSEGFTELIGDTTRDYGRNVQRSLNNAGDALNESRDIGFGLAFLKSVRWVLQGVLWDGLVSPITKLGVGSVGYVTVNLGIYPAMVVVSEGLVLTNLAVEVTWNSAGAVYDLVAPTAVSAVASLYSVFQFTGGNALAGATAIGGTAIGSGEIVGGQVAGAAVKGVGLITGKSVQYIGVPLAAAGVTTGSGMVGLVAGSAGTITGASMVVAGEVASLTTKGFGNVIADTTLVGGTVASVAVGTTLGVYELSKAVIVPAGYQLGGGIVLGYGTLTHLGAHSVLAVSDAAYLVLSLEGPRWVIYAVKGNLGEGDDLPPGTMLDLEAMQGAGEEFAYLPISDEEMSNVVNSVYQELPVNDDNWDEAYDFDDE